MKRAPRTERPRGASPCFSLIELLVTIAIIAILAGLLLPTLGKAREMARRTQCVGNMKQLGSAVQLYATDWGGYLWHYTYGYWHCDANKARQYLGSQLYVGVGNYYYPKTLVCPSDKTFPTPGATAEARDFSSYGISWRYAQTGYYSQDSRMTLYKNPSQKVIFAESYHYQEYCTVPGYYNEQMPTKAAYMTGAIVSGSTIGVNARHNKSGNTLWMDLHVEPISADRLIEVSTTAGYWKN